MAAILRTGLASFAAGRSSVLTSGKDHWLWWMGADNADGRLIAGGVATASVGDSANYYVTRSSDLFVKGLFYRGQYGDSRLTKMDALVSTASSVARVLAHSGHMTFHMKNGDVSGTSCKTYGPVGPEVLAIRLSAGAGYSLALRPPSPDRRIRLRILRDGRLMAWCA